MTEITLKESIIASEKGGSRKLVQQRDDGVIQYAFVAYLAADLAYRNTPATQQLPLMFGDILVEKIHPATNSRS